MSPAPNTSRRFFQTSPHHRLRSPGSPSATNFASSDAAAKTAFKMPAAASAASKDFPHPRRDDSVVEEKHGVKVSRVGKKTDGCCIKTMSAVISTFWWPRKENAVNMGNCCCLEVV